MSSISSYLVGVTDSPAGAGVKEFLGTQSTPNGALSQAFDWVPGGTEFSMRAWSASVTISVSSATVPPWDVAAFQVPAGYVFIVESVSVNHVAAAACWLRLSTRYLLGGNCAQAAPAAGAAPTVAAAAQFGSGLSAAAYSYKLAQFNALNQEGPLSTVSANVTPTANQGVNITIPALGTGAVGYRIYRSLGGAAAGPWYWVDDAAGGTTYLDVVADSYLTGARGSTQHPGTTWGTAFVGATASGAVEMVYENVGVALAAAPANVSYVSGKGIPSVVAFAPATTANTRVRIPLSGEGRAFAASGPASFQIQNPQIADYGVTKFLGFDKSYATIAGQWVVWGYTAGATTEFVTAGIAGGRQERKFIKPLVYHPGDTIVGQLGTHGAATASVYEVEIQGRYFALPT